MADASPLWSGVVTGLFTLGGSLGAIAITSVATARRDAAQERLEAKKRRAEKFEELVAAIYEAAYWLEGLRDREAFGRDGIPIATSPFAKVQSISSVYFPQFNHQVIELASAVDLYRDWIYRAAKKRTDHPIDRTATERGVDALMPYVEKREALLDALKTFAHEEFQ